MNSNLVIVAFLCLWSVPLVMTGWLVWHHVISVLREDHRRTVEDREVELLESWWVAS